MARRANVIGACGATIALMILTLAAGQKLAAADVDGRSQAQLLRRSYMSTATEKQREYFLYLPAGYHTETGKRWPVILFLHGGGERGDGLGDLEDASFAVLANDAYGLERPDGAVKDVAVKQVLDRLVVCIAVAGLLNRHPRESYRLLGGGGGRRVHDPVDLVLGQLGEARLGVLRTPRLGAGVPNRVEVPIGRCGWFGHGSY